MTSCEMNRSVVLLLTVGHEALATLDIDYSGIFIIIATMGGARSKRKPELFTKTENF